jgi:hypothetical protein
VLQCMDSVVVSRRQPVGLHSRASPRPLKDPFGESRRNRWSPYWACRCEQRIAIIVARRQEDRDIDGTGVRQVTADSAWDHRGHPVALIWPSRAPPADSPCGMGVFTTGHPMPDCARRVFLVPAAPSASGHPIKLSDHDGAMATFMPR